MVVVEEAVVDTVIDVVVVLVFIIIVVIVIVVVVFIFIFLNYNKNNLQQLNTVYGNNGLVPVSDMLIYCPQHLYKSTF